MLYMGTQIMIDQDILIAQEQAHVAYVEYLNILYGIYLKGYTFSKPVVKVIGNEIQSINSEVIKYE